MLLDKIPFLLLSLASALITLLAQQSWQAVVPLVRIPLAARIATGFKALIAYLFNMIWPFELSPFYPYPKTIILLWSEYLFPVLLVFGITIVAILAAKRRKIWTASWSYYAATLLPVLGIVQVGAQSMADRYTYLPSLAPFLGAGVCAVWGYGKIVAIRPGIVVKLACISTAILVFVSLSYLTIIQIGIWKNSFTLWSYVIERNPGISFAHNNLGGFYLKQGATEKAAAEYNAALKLNPDDPEVHNNLGLVFIRQKRLDEAIAEYKAALKMRPDSTKAHINLGLAYMTLGRFDEAREEYEAVARNDPDNAEAHNNLGVVYENQGGAVKAIDEYRAALKLNPGYADAHYNLGCIYGSMGKAHEAAREFREVLRLKPTDNEAREKLDSLYEELQTGVK